MLMIPESLKGNDQGWQQWDSKDTANVTVTSSRIVLFQLVCYNPSPAIAFLVLHKWKHCSRIIMSATFFYQTVLLFQDFTHKWWMDSWIVWLTTRAALSWDSHFLQNQGPVGTCTMP